MSHELTRVEGNATIILERRGSKIIPKINIYESSRKIEQILIGKDFREVPEIISRICGVCHVPHKLGGIMAIENALGVKVNKEIDKLRELLTLGGIMNSHVLHLFFMVLPDMKSGDNIFEIRDKKITRIGLRLQKVSEQIIKVIGGREVHTLTPIVGGFTKMPEKEDLKELLKNLKQVRREVLKTVEIFSKYKKDLKFKRKSLHISLKGEKKYEILKGDVVSGKEVIKPEEFVKSIKEYEVDYSTSKFLNFRGKSYMVGALSRLINNGKYLPQKIRKYLKILEWDSPFSNNLAQAIEIYYCVERAIEIIENLRLKQEKVKISPKEGEGINITEAPRGILIHHYRINKSGKIKYANIITPTAQNLKSMENDASNFIPLIPKKELKYFLERLIRAYDPCISCATHFLEVKFK